MTKIIIIGGGIAGCTTALELASVGFDVIILEKNSDILQSTSAKTPGRMGLGYHYFDTATAKTYMEHTIDFMQKYPNCFLGDEKKPYLQNGRYFIVKDSLLSMQELMARYDEAALHYETLCNNNPQNKIFTTTHLHRALYPHEFQDDVNCDKISYAIETKEHLLNWKKFETQLREELAQFPNIKILTNCEIVDAKRQPSKEFILTNQHGAELASNVIVNCTWQNIENIGQKVGLPNKEPMTSRLKLLCEVALPESLTERPSMFFCIGPHAMFSNLGNGIGRITFAPVTNFGTVLAEDSMPEIWQRWLQDGLNETETAEYGQEIIDGVTKYIPKMSGAKVLSVLPGIVKSKGKVELENPQSAFHKRDYSGVEARLDGWIDNAAMKLFYCLGNAKEVLEIIQNQQRKKPNNEYRLICVLDSVGDEFSDFDLSPNYLHIHALKSDQLESLEKFKNSLSFDEANYSIKQWGIPLENSAHSRSEKVSLQDVKKFGQIGIGSAARGDEILKNFIGGGEGFLFNNQGFRITKGGKAFAMRDDEKFWTFQVANFNGAKILPQFLEEKVSGRNALKEILLQHSQGKPFVAVFDAVFDEQSFVRSNGIFPEDASENEVAKKSQSLFEAIGDTKGGHLVGGSCNQGDLKSLSENLFSENFQNENILDNDFALTITSEVLLKPINEVLIARQDGSFRKPRSKIVARDAAIKI